MDPHDVSVNFDIFSSRVPVCRLCLHISPENVSLFSNLSKAEGVIAKIAKHLSVKVDEQDELPKTLCLQCWTKLNTFHSYYCEVGSVQGKLASLRKKWLWEGKSMLVGEISPADLLNIEMQESENHESLNYHDETFQNGGRGGSVKPENDSLGKLSMIVDSSSILHETRIEGSSGGMEHQRHQNLADCTVSVPQCGDTSASHHKQKRLGTRHGATGLGVNQNAASKPINSNSIEGTSTESNEDEIWKSYDNSSPLGSDEHQSSLQGNEMYHTSPQANKEQNRSQRGSEEHHKTAYRTRYSGDTLEQALKELKNGKMSLRKIAAKFNIPRSTLWGQYVGAHAQSPGRPSVLSAQEEAAVVVCLMECLAEWDYPLTRDDLQAIIQAHLNRSGRIEKRFKDNVPSLDWVRNLLKRHEALSDYMGQKVKQAKKCDDHMAVNKLFNTLEEVLQGVVPQNIIFYSEFNFSDDLSAISTVSKRDSRSECAPLSGVTSMIAASADGTLLTPYGNSSRWFDLPLFENWFLSVCLPQLRKSGPKVIIGDCLSTYFSVHILRICRENNIRFVFVPSHLMQLCHPIDVAFSPFLEIHWRNIISHWRETNIDGILCEKFENLLKEVLEKIEAFNAHFILAGIESCGIIPCDRAVVLQKLPHGSSYVWPNT